MCEAEVEESERKLASMGTGEHGVKGEEGWAEVSPGVEGHHEVNSVVFEALEVHSLACH